ncbi:gliding motility protein SprC [uncultured Flavobacterium sp.]|uniref:gliding motility protein SprC n=1 Tax=uncultured Flavobacterium sp. TaxID=165435 RepID=UPI00308162E8
MIQKTTLTITHFFLLFSILFCTESSLHAQSIVPDILTFDRICAGGSTNPTYKATFTYTGYAVGTTFSVELSDKTGSFSNPTAIVFVGENDDTPNKKTITFSIPADIVGSDTYSLRIKSSGGQPASPSFFSSTAKKQFPIYYKIHDKQYTINNFNGSATFCAGGSLVLSIDPDRVSPANDSPLKYPSITYNWFRDNGPTSQPTLLAGASGPTFTVTTAGTYYVESNYGSCTSLSYSNRVVVSASGAGSAFTIDSSLGNPFCATEGEGTVLTATVGSGNSYVWKKDNVVINGANTRSITATEPAIYTVEIDFGGCTGSSSINLKSNGFNASIDVADEYILKDGELLKVNITTDASNPKVEWFLNGNAIQGATATSYTVATIGSYKAVISQTAGCVVTKEFTFKVKSETALVTNVIPNILKLSGANPYWNIPDVYKNDTTKVIIISSNGDKVLDVVNYQGDWPQTAIDFKNVNPVYYYVIQSDTGEKKGSITVIK